MKGAPAKLDDALNAMTRQGSQGTRAIVRLYLPGTVADFHDGRKRTPPSFGQMRKVNSPGLGHTSGSHGAGQTERAYTRAAAKFPRALSLGAPAVTLLHHPHHPRAHARVNIAADFELADRVYFHRVCTSGLHNTRPQWRGSDLQSARPTVSNGFVVLRWTF